jgi:hypothetical protein
MSSIPTPRPRYRVEVEPEAHETATIIAHVLDRSASGVISDLLEEAARDTPRDRDLQGVARLVQATPRSSLTTESPS